MQIQTNVALAPYTSLNCGGPAKQFVLCETVEELVQILTDYTGDDVHIFGFGTNSLISDDGLPGLTVLLRGGSVNIEDGVLTADAGVWWDDVITLALDQKLWGIELTSGIPSSVGGAVLGNIAAYGQQVSDTLQWVEVYNLKTRQVERMAATGIQFEYRASSLQTQANLIVLRAAFKLSTAATTPLAYASALKVAEELQLNPAVLTDRHKIIIEARRRAGSLYNPDDPNAAHTAGSFFKNPLVSSEQAEAIAAYDETSKPLELILQQSKVHGGDTKRASAAHVLLAAGFKRGQRWGSVRLHPDHILKIENTGGATAQQIYDVAQEIMQQVYSRLGIQLIPEVRFVGQFE